MSLAPHPEMEPILAEMRANPPPDYARMPIAEARQTALAGMMVWNADMPDVPVREATIGGVRCKVLNQGAGAGTIVFVHGGGWTFGSPESHEGCARRLALAAGMEAVLPDYRLAPEHACPAGIDDVLAVCATLRRPYVLAGDSAGANIALAAALAGARPAMLSLIYGCFAPIFDTRSHRDCGDGRFGLSSARMRWFWDNWQGAGGDNRAAPLDGEFAGLPHTHLLAAGLDCLRDDTFLLAGKLAAAGVSLRVDSVPGVVHGFLQMSPRLGPARTAITGLGEEIRQVLAS